MTSGGASGAAGDEARWPVPGEPGLTEALLTTRAMRRFSYEPVDPAVIEACLAAAVQAPSGGNIQPYQFVVVTDPGRRAEIGRWYRQAYDRYEPAVAALVPPFPATPDGDEARRRHERSWAASRHLAETIGTVPVHVLVVMPRISMTVTDDAGAMDVGAVEASVYPAVEALLLALRAHGLGSCLTTVARIHEAEVLGVCEVPVERYSLAALLPVGHPTGRWGVAPRRPAPTITHWDAWGRRTR